jgi:1-deoxy-D-xylulose-5-phosphate synthase
MTALPVGKAQLRRRGEKLALLAFGGVLTAALEAGSALNATVVNMRFVKPLDEGLLAELSSSHEFFVTVEDNVILGGAGSAVLEVLQRLRSKNSVLQLGIPDRFIDHGDPAALTKECGLDVAGILASIRAWAI